jgi:hypothetical protein
MSTGIHWIAGLDVVTMKTSPPLPEITAAAQQTFTYYTEMTNNNIPGLWIRQSAYHWETRKAVLKGVNRKKHEYVVFKDAGGKEKIYTTVAM